MLGGSQQHRPGGWDRCRVGERLHAALAGLQELQVLREKQRALVSGALAMQPQPAARGDQARSKEHRLEATLTALKEQLSRLRRQDVGLKSHLDQLDQQISELKLDVRKTSSEYLDSDSRPSSGFYDLSDGGSCSLSNSCTSVYSESISSSHTSLLPSCQQPKTRLSVFDYRPKSADETTVHTTKFQHQGVYVSDGCRIKASTDISGTPARSRPRPVSTGDLERLLPEDTGFQKVTNPKFVPPLCHGVEFQFQSVDPKYQNDLVSKSGNDVYPYPSPLHAVALQSPLFSLVGVPLETDNHPSPSKPTPNVTGPSLIRTRPVIEARPGGYINKLLQLTRCRGNNHADASERVSTKSQPSTVPQRLIITPSTGGVKISSSSNQLEKQGSSLEAYVDTAAKKKQRKWQSTVEISAKAHLASLSSGFGLGPPRQPVRRAGVLRTVSMRARSKHHRQGTYAKSESDHSEYSAECASLFHSTIAETSEGEVSDYTTNRFGDSESSESDSEGSSNSSSLTLDYDDADENELVWPEASVRQPAAVLTSSKPLPPMPKICRIKASKALKKKIRRFQPASLKVMTMV
ncbi:dapper homolog 2 isoform X3 [Lepidochelys kempii]|uniref:dapper homolog 2 isoform X3 n=1 Tax=Lepidochelys kempii TaxID=8472 RepID=UPI003C7051B5